MSTTHTTLYSWHAAVSAPRAQQSRGPFLARIIKCKMTTSQSCPVIGWAHASLCSAGQASLRPPHSPRATPTAHGPRATALPARAFRPPCVIMCVVREGRGVHMLSDSTCISRCKSAASPPRPTGPWTLRYTQRTLGAVLYVCGSRDLASVSYLADITLFAR